MEESQNQGSSLFEMEVDLTAQNNLNTISKWSKFIAITGFICTALAVFGMAMAWSRLTDGTSSMSRFMPIGATDALWVVVIILVIFGVLFIALLYFLLQSANFLRKGLYGRSSLEIAQGFKAMRSFFNISIIFSTLSGLATLYTLTNF